MANPYYKQHWIEIEAERHQAYRHILAYHPALEPADPATRSRARPCHSEQIAKDEVERWLSDIDGAITARQYLMVLPQFVARGTHKQQRDG